MRIQNPTQEKLKELNTNLRNHINQTHNLVETLYLDLGFKVVRILNYAEEFTPLIEKQLTYIIKRDSKTYDETIVLWKESDINNLYKIIDPSLDPKTNFQARINMIYAHRKYDDLWVFDDNYSQINPLISVDIYGRIVNSYDAPNKTYFYGVENLEPEEFIKQGHIFVHMFNKITKTENSNLVHGACVGIDNKGILFCARGQRGKSTLTVLSMMKGFEYVSDDYLTIENKDDKLVASPIYSIITLSPRMYNELYDELEGCRFVSNNARKDKYVINIAKFHNQFKKDYPIEFCMFPEIVSDKEPSIRECDKTEKGRAIVQLIQSTVFQMQDICNHDVIHKLFNMVKDFKFYKINLCNDIFKNTEFLRDFIKKYKPQPKEIETSLERILIDITFDIANVLDTETGTIYTMNKFATNIFENLLKGVSKENILNKLQANKNTAEIKPYFDILIHQFEKIGLMKNYKNLDIEANINFEIAEEDKYKLSITEYTTKECLELIKENENELCIK